MTLYALQVGQGPVKPYLMVQPPMTIEEIDLLIDEADMRREAEIPSQGFYLSFCGFDADDRNLWEIPSALTFIDLLVSRGMMSLLEVNAPVPPEKYDPTACGALQLWAWHKRMGGIFVMDRPLIDRFFSDLEVSNQFIEQRRKESA